MEESLMIKNYKDQWNIATQYSKSSLVPDNYKGHPENVVIALGMAEKIGIDVFTTMQNLNVVRGKANWSGSFCRTLIEKTGKYEKLDLVFVGEKGKDNYGCYVEAIRKSDGKTIKGVTVDWAMVKAEGWNKNTKWNSMTDLMLSYRAMSFFARVNCPEALSGVYTSEEIEDINLKTEVVEIKDILSEENG